MESEPCSSGGNPPRETKNFLRALLGDKIVENGMNLDVKMEDDEGGWPPLKDTTRTNSGRAVVTKGDEMMGASPSRAGITSNRPAPSLEVKFSCFPTLDDSLNNNTRKRLRNDEALEGILLVRRPLHKPPRSQHPITFNILDAIQVAVANKLERRKQLNPKKVTPECTNCGNHLDSDRPMRNKGKLRLVIKKKSLSRIKEAIMVARLARNMARAQHNPPEETTHQPLNIASSSSRAQYRPEGTTETHQAIAASSSSQDIPQESKQNQLTVEERMERAVEELRKEFVRAKLIDSSQPDSVLPLPSQSNIQHKDKHSMIALLNSIHTRKFRPYCNNIVTKELLETVSALVKSLREFQDRVYRNELIKFKLKQRYVCGFKQTIKYLRYGQLKLIVVATNLEVYQDEPMHEMLGAIIETAKMKQVPCVFAGTSHNLGAWTCKQNRISILGIINYMGAEELYRKVCDLLVDAKSQYEVKLNANKKAMPPDEFSCHNHQHLDRVLEEMINATMLMTLTGSDSDTNSDKPMDG